MNIWELLGIEATIDEEEIKKAFAQKATEFHPEENAAEFQQLFSAYKVALGHAKAKKYSYEQMSSHDEWIELSVSENEVDENEDDSYGVQFDEISVRAQEKTNFGIEKLRELKIRDLSWKKRHEFLAALVNADNFVTILQEHEKFRFDFAQMIDGRYFNFSNMALIKKKLPQQQGITSLRSIHISLDAYNKRLLSCIFIISFIPSFVAQLMSEGYFYIYQTVFMALVMTVLVVLTILIRMKKIPFDITMLKKKRVKVLLFFCLITNLILFYVQNQTRVLLLAVSAYCLLIYCCVIWSSRQKAKKEADSKFYLDSSQNEGGYLVNRLKSVIREEKKKAKCKAKIHEIMTDSNIKDLFNSENKNVFYDFIWHFKFEVKPLIPYFYKLVKDFIEKPKTNIDMMFKAYIEYKNYRMTEERIFTTIWKIMLVLCIFVEYSRYPRIDILYSLDFSRLPAYIFSASGVLTLITIGSGVTYFIRRHKYYHDYRKYFRAEYSVFFQWIVVLLAIVEPSVACYLIGGFWAIIGVIVIANDYDLRQRR